MSVPPDIVALAERRAAARAARDFAAADALRDELLAAGWAVTDGPDGWDLSPAGPAAPSGPSAAHDVARVLEEPATALASVHWVCEGWPEDIDRAIAAFRAHAPAGATQYVVADVTGQAPDRWGEDVEVVGSRRGRAGARRATPASVDRAGTSSSPSTARSSRPGTGSVPWPPRSPTVASASSVRSGSSPGTSVSSRRRPDRGRATRSRGT